MSRTLGALMALALAVPAGAAQLASLEADALRAARPGDALTVVRDGTSIPAQVRRVDVTAPDGRVVLAERTDALGDVILAIRGDVTRGYVTGIDGTWHVQRDGAEATTFTRTPDGFDCGVGDPERALQGPMIETSPIGSCDAGSFHDILVLYDQEVENIWGGPIGTAAEIDAVMALSNNALEDSLVSPRFRLVFSWKISEPANSVSLGELTGTSDGVIDEIHELRNLVAADQVVLIYPGGGGVANGVGSLSAGQAARAFNRSGLFSFPYVFPHEIGHNMGCCHAAGDGGGCGNGLLFTYSKGHRWFGNSGQQWRTIMAYSPGARVGQFSNPDVNFDGQPTGTPTANNALTMEISNDLVAGFRCESTAVCRGLSLPIELADCNENGLPDGCDILAGSSFDNNADGLPDECDDCFDIDGDNSVGFGDLLRVISAWGVCSGPCPEDLDVSGAVAFGDITIVLSAWGDCQ